MCSVQCAMCNEKLKIQKADFMFESEIGFFTLHHVFIILESKYSCYSVVNQLYIKSAV